MVKLYDVDPEADTLLILPQSTEEFAPWDSNSSDIATASSTELRIKVSSRHLSLASKPLRNKLKYATTQQPDGRVHINITGHDHEAVKIVMNIIHNRGRRVPKSVDLETLAKIALFVNAFQCYDAVEVYADRWISKLESSLPTNYGRDLILGIFVAYVFHLTDLFKTLTQTAIAQSNGPLRDLGLPIREKLIKSIDAQRQGLVEQGVALISNVADDLRDGKAACASGYDSLLLGELIKTLHQNKLSIWPKPQKPYEGIGLGAIIQTVRDVQSRARHYGQNAFSIGSARVRETNLKRKTPEAQPVQQPTPESSPELRPADAHDCGVDDLLSPIVPQLEALQKEVAGLDLESKLGYYLY